MKKIFYLLTILILFSSCGDDITTEKEPELLQGYFNETELDVYLTDETNCEVGYSIRLTLWLKHRTGDHVFYRKIVRKLDRDSISREQLEATIITEKELLKSELECVDYGRAMQEKYQ